MGGVSGYSAAGMTSQGGCFIADSLASELLSVIFYPTQQVLLPALHFL